MGIVGRVFEVLGISGDGTDYFFYEKIGIMNYFTSVAIPQPGDLVIYCSGDEITHSGIVIKDDIIESRWGGITSVFIHLLWCVPDIYGKEVYYFRRNGTAEDLLNAVQERLKKKSVREKCNSLSCETQKILFESAAHRSDFHEDMQHYFDGSDKTSPNYYARKIFTLLERDMGVRVNGRDAQYRTALMYASGVGDATSVRLLLRYGAHSTYWDYSGNTALSLASKNGHQEVVDILSKVKGK